MNNIAINGLFLNKENTGGGRYLTDLIKGLEPYSRNFIFFPFLKSQAIKQLGSRVNFNYIDVGTIPTFRPYRLIWENLSLPKILEAKKIDLFHAIAFTLPAKIKCKSVITIFDMTFLKMPSVHQKRKVFYFKKMLPLALKKADKIIAISNQTKNDIIELAGIAPEKIRVIYIGVSNEFTPFADKNLVEKVKSKYSLPREYILFVGAIEPRKNLKNLVLAYAKLKRKGCAHKLVITGRFGWNYKDVLRTIKNKGLREEIIFTDYVLQNDLPFIYNGADLFVYPSLYEGFGIPVMEAMACGIPVVTSNISSLPEITQGAAILVDPLDNEAIFLGMDKVLKDRRLAGEMSAKGVERARSFSLRNMAEDTVSLYRDILNAG